MVTLLVLYNNGYFIIIIIIRMLHLAYKVEWNQVWMIKIVLQVSRNYS